MEDLYKKDPNEPDHYNGQSSEPDILDNKVKWALGSTAVSKARGLWWNSNRTIQNPKG